MYALILLVVGLVAAEAGKDSTAGGSTYLVAAPVPRSADEPVAESGPQSVPNSGKGGKAGAAPDTNGDEPLADNEADNAGDDMQPADSGYHSQGSRRSYPSSYAHDAMPFAWGGPYMEYAYGYPGDMIMDPLMMMNPMANMRGSYVRYYSFNGNDDDYLDRGFNSLDRYSGSTSGLGTNNRYNGGMSNIGTSNRYSGGAYSSVSRPSGQFNGQGNSMRGRNDQRGGRDDQRRQDGEAFRGEYYRGNRLRA